MLGNINEVKAILELTDINALDDVSSSSWYMVIVNSTPVGLSISK